MRLLRFFLLLIGLWAESALQSAVAQTVDVPALLAQAVVKATTAAGGWDIGSPSMQLGDADYVMVAPSGAIMVGKRFLDKVSAESDREDLLQFVLLHEYRHIHQLRRGTVHQRPLLECDADFHAGLRLSNTLLQQAPEGQADAALGRVLNLQRAGSRLNRLAGAEGHGHLTAEQRFLAGAFASWRAIHQWLSRTGRGGEKRYSELAARAQSFVEPLTEDDVTWSAKFCDAMLRGGDSERGRISLLPKKFDLVDSDKGRGLFKTSYEIRNDSEWPLRVVGWQVIGVYAKGNDKDLTQYTAAHANALDLVVPAKGSSEVTWLQMYPRVASTMDVFIWNNPFFPQMILVASRAGPREEQPSCQSTWKAPTDAALAELFDFLIRTGNTAARQFQGVRGELQHSVLMSSTQFYHFVSLPVRASRAQSFISMHKDGSGASAHISLLETESQAEAEKLYNEIVAAFQASCGAKVIDEGPDKDGDPRMIVRRLTLLSRATLYFRAPSSKPEAGSKPMYSVSWTVRPLE